MSERKKAKAKPKPKPSKTTKPKAKKKPATKKKTPAKKATAKKKTKKEKTKNDKKFTGILLNFTAHIAIHPDARPKWITEVDGSRGWSKFNEFLKFDVLGRLRFNLHDRSKKIGIQIPTYDLVEACLLDYVISSRHLLKTLREGDQKHLESARTVTLDFSSVTSLTKSLADYLRKLIEFQDVTSSDHTIESPPKGSKTCIFPPEKMSLLNNVSIIAVEDTQKIVQFFTDLILESKGTYIPMWIRETKVEGHSLVYLTMKFPQSIPFSSEDLSESERATNLLAADLPPYYFTAQSTLGRRPDITNFLLIEVSSIEKCVPQRDDYGFELVLNEADFPKGPLKEACLVRDFIHRREKILELTRILNITQNRFNQLLGELPIGYTQDLDERRNRLKKLNCVYEGLTILQRSTSIAETRLSKFPKAKHFGEAVAIFFPLFSGLPFDATVQLHQLADVTHQLDMLEKSVETRISIERAAIDQSREAYENRREESYNFLSMILGVLVIFEVFASFLSWFLPEVNLIGYVIWVVMLLLLSLVIILSVQRFLRKSNES